jgi:hypothetical protein
VTAFVVVLMVFLTLLTVADLLPVLVGPPARVDRRRGQPSPSRVCTRGTPGR